MVRVPTPTDGHVSSKLPAAGADHATRLAGSMCSIRRPAIIEDGVTVRPVL